MKKILIVENYALWQVNSVNDIFKIFLSVSFDFAKNWKVILTKLGNLKNY